MFGLSPSRASGRRRLAVASAVALVTPGLAHADEAAFTPTPALDLDTLGAVVARRSREVQAGSLELDAATTEARQARVLGNPQLDGTWATIPVGPTNPEGLSSPMTRVPSYGVGVSYTFLVGKRGPRARRADALADSARARVAATTRAQAVSLAHLLGEMAVATMRVDGLRELIEEQRRGITLAEARLRTGFGTPLDVDRLEIERSRTEQQALSNESDLHEAAAACAGMLGQRCHPFASADDARAFLDAWTRRAARIVRSSERRPDVRALDAARRATRAEAELARATALPDPTVRVGYLYDQFVISGNQRHSLNLSVSIPLPLLDGGGVQRDGALAREARLSAQRARLLDAAAARIGALREALATRTRRRELLVSQTLPRARAVVDDLERAAAARLIPLTDVIQARRTLSELLIQHADAEGDVFQTAVELLAEAPSEADEVAR